MTWVIAQASVAGTSHTKNGRPSDDNCFAGLESTSDGRQALVAIVSDGAGSASHGGAGSELAVETLARAIAKRMAQASGNPELSWIRDGVDAIRESIADAASRESLEMRDFSCTLLGVVSVGDDTLVFQIGDGAIVIGSGEALRVPIWPMGGEYANMTHFVTDDDAPEKLEVMLLQERVERVAVFSDGIQRLALNMAAQKPHLPFFLPMFDSLGRTDQTAEDEVSAALVGYLSSDAVNGRTDDDKTLVLAHRK